jgi:hypothetical protein
MLGFLIVWTLSYQACREDEDNPDWQKRQGQGERHIVATNTFPPSL